MRYAWCHVRTTTLIDALARHVLAGTVLHADDTPVPVLARGKTDKGRLWVYVRDDRPFAGGAPPAARLLATYTFAGGQFSIRQFGKVVSQWKVTVAGQAVDVGTINLSTSGSSSS